MSAYFSTDTPATDSLHIVPGDDLPTVTLGPGITADVLLGVALNISVVTLAPGAEAPVHTHAEEQMGYIVRGSCEFFDGTQSARLEPGDTYHAPSGAPHGARAYEDGCLIIDVFSPPRSGIRELIEQATKV